MAQIPTTREPDFALHPSPYCSHDIVISLPHHLVKDIFRHEVSALVRAWPYFPPIPSRTRRIWIYDRSSQTIIYIVRLDYHCCPARLYQLANPITLETMERRYSYGLDQVPGPAPRWLHGYAKSRSRVW